MKHRPILFDLLIRYLSNQINHIHTETCNPLIQPPVHHPVHFTAYLRVLPVQIRLLNGKQMKIILSAAFLIFPGRPAEAGAPVIRLLSLFGFLPDIIIPVEIVLTFPAFLKPGMLVRGMVHHQIHHQLHSPRMDFFQHPVKIRHRPEILHNGLVIADIITIIVIGRLIYRRKPDNIRSQLLQIIQLPRNPV